MKLPACIARLLGRKTLTGLPPNTERLEVFPNVVDGWHYRLKAENNRTEWTSEAYPKSVAWTRARLWGVRLGCPVIERELRP